MKETLEEAAKSNYDNKTAKIPVPTSHWLNSEFLQIQNFKEDAKWQVERMYSEEEVYELLLKHQSAYRSTVRNTSPLDWSFDIKQWFENFKK
jgi:hypothetical protein